MTRETKLGLVVAGSFLALVGGVVVARLKQVELPGDGGEPGAVASGETEKTPVADTPKTPAAAPVPEPEKHVNPVSADAVAKAGASKMPSGDAKPPQDVLTPPPAAPTPAQVINPAPLIQPDTKAAPVATDTPVKAPADAAPAFPVNETPDPATFVGPLPHSPADKASASGPVVINPPAPAPADEKALPNTTPATEPAQPMPAAVVNPAPAPAVVVNPAPTPTATQTTPAAVQPTPVAVQPTPAEPVAIPPMPPPPPASAPTPTVINQPAAVETPNTSVAPPPPLNPEVTKNAVATVTIVPASGAGTGGGTNTGATLEAPRVPAAAPPRDPFVAPSHPATPPEPKRDSYLEEQYHWKPGDSFAALSNQYYMTPKYADALMKYNQEYPLATREMRQNPPAPQPGQGIWIPPVRILERDYAAQIHDLAPVTPATPTSRPAVEAVGPPPGLANSGFGNAAPQFYRVRANGESVQEIARRTLGNSAQAGRIQQLNQTLSPDPRLPIPAGTVLRLPGDAKVEKADQP